MFKTNFYDFKSFCYFSIDLYFIGKKSSRIVTYRKWKQGVTMSVVSVPSVEESKVNSMFRWTIVKIN
jgi:hypothetical protein